MAFAPQFLDDIRARVPLADVIGRRAKLIKRGREYVALCPFHNEKTPSFTINEDKGFYHCFGCGAHGDVIGFLMQTEGLAFPEAVERLAGQAGLQIPASSPEDAARAEKRDSLADVTEAACAWFEGRLRRPEGRAALDYLKGRGLADETIARFRLGFAPDARDALKKALEGKGIARDRLIEAGLLIQPEDRGRAPYDRFRGRVIFPIADRRGRVIAFGGRILGEGEPKYLNSPETPLFDKGRTLYNIADAAPAARKGADMVVVEGYMDVIALVQAGFEGAVAPLGTALTEPQIELMWRAADEPVLCFDGDEAGRRAAARAAERALPLLQPGKSLRFAMLPGGEDPDSLVRGAGAGAMRRVCAAARPLVDQIWQMETASRPADTPERRALVRKNLRQRAAEIADREVQDYYRNEFEDRLHAAFGQRRGAGGSWAGYQAGYRAGGQRARRPGGPAEAGVDMGLRSDGNVGVLALRQQQALVASIVNHPELLGVLDEEFGTLELAAGDLDRLRQEIVKAWHPALDTAALQSHLRDYGFGDVLGRILSRDVYVLAPFAGPTAEAGEVRQGWRHLYEVFRRRRNDEEIIEARERFAGDPSERNWAYLAAVTRPASISGDEETGPAADNGTVTKS